ncbi:Segregation/condensation protein A [Acetobacteraceae bacterium EV16G]|uniref:Segregation and condensation protein A n=1 Tax=Sorlinia euscelidii TaxID=3081148 RepID=A0ABU7U6D2_9PROT
MRAPTPIPAENLPEATLKEAEKPWLALDGFEGPLDLLFDLARAQKFDLTQLSILALVEQYLAFMEHARQVRIELEADWLVMAAWLTWLKSKLLLPQDDALQDVQEATGQLQDRLEALQQVRSAAAWLSGRPILDEVVFARGEEERLTVIDRSGLTTDLPVLIGAYLSLHRRRHRKKIYTPRLAQFWTIGDALSALQRLLNTTQRGCWRDLEEIFRAQALETPFAFKAAFAGALTACLELAKTGALELEQSEPFAPIRFGPAVSGEISS